MSVHFRFFFFKQKTAYEMRISDWSSDVCSSDLVEKGGAAGIAAVPPTRRRGFATEFEVALFDSYVVGGAEGHGHRAGLSATQVTLTSMFITRVSEGCKRDDKGDNALLPGKAFGRRPSRGAGPQGNSGCKRKRGSTRNGASVREPGFAEGTEGRGVGKEGDRTGR